LAAAVREVALYRLCASFYVFACLVASKLLGLKVLGTGVSSTSGLLLLLKNDPISAFVALAILTRELSSFF
jgi:hypothetical protein